MRQTASDKTKELICGQAANISRRSRVDRHASVLTVLPTCTTHFVFVKFSLTIVQNGDSNNKEEDELVATRFKPQRLLSCSAENDKTTIMLQFDINTTGHHKSRSDLV